MRRVILSILAGCLFSWLWFQLTWTFFGQRLPGWLHIYPLSPGYGLLGLLERFVDFRASEISDVLGVVLFHGVNAVVWGAIFYSLVTLYVRRKARRRESRSTRGESAGGS
jgi:hypothetical protein